jgi:hypothetical protein
LRSLLNHRGQRLPSDAAEVPNAAQNDMNPVRLSRVPCATPMGARASGKGAVMGVHISDHVVGDILLEVSRGIELEYIDPLSIVLESGKIAIIS